MTLRADAEKVFNKIQYSFIKKTLCRLGIEGTSSNWQRTSMKKQTNKPAAKHFPAKIKNKAKASTFHHS